MTRLVIRWLAAFALCVAGIASAHAGDDLAVGALAPPIALTALDGRHYELGALRGKVVILTFWATWCAPCREELPLLSDYAKRHARDGLVVLGFSLDTPDRLQQVRVVAAQLDFPVGLLGDPHVPGYGRIWHLPVNFTIDRAGRLADNGWEDPNPVWTRARLEWIVTPLLKSHDSSAVAR